MGPSPLTGLQFYHHLMHTGPNLAEEQQIGALCQEGLVLWRVGQEGGLLTVPAKRSCSRPLPQLTGSKDKRQIPLQSLVSGRAGVWAPVGGVSRKFFQLCHISGEDQWKVSSSDLMQTEQHF